MLSDINAPPSLVQGPPLPAPRPPAPNLTPDYSQPPADISPIIAGIPAPPAPPVKYTPTPEELQTAETPATYTPSPEDLAQADVKVRPLHDMTVDQLVQAAKDDPTNFDPISIFQQSPQEDRIDPMVNEKVAEVFNKLRQENHYVPSAGTMVKNVASGVWDFLKSQTYLGRVLTSAPVVTEELIKDHIEGKQPDPSTFAGALTDDQRRQAGEYIAGLAQSGIGMGAQAVRAFHFLARRVPVVGEKSLKDYDSQEKLAALGAEMAYRAGMQRLATKGVSPERAKELEQAGFPMRPEEVATHAAGNPYAWELMGKGFGAATGLAGGAVKAGIKAAVAPELVAGLSELGQKATAAVPKAVGGTMEALGEAGKKVSGLVEKTAPTVGKYGGGAAGVLAGHQVAGPAGLVVGAMEGLEKGAKLGEKVSEGAEKFSGKMESLSEVGRQVAGKSPLVSPVAVALKSGAEAVPAAAANVAQGALFDAGLMATTAETPQEREQFAPFGSTFGLLGAGRVLGGRTLSGLIAAPREYGTKTIMPSTGNFPALDAAHNEAVSTAKANHEDGIVTRVNAIRGFLRTAVPGTDLFYVPRPEPGETDKLPSLLQGLKMTAPDGTATPIDAATAQQWSDTAGMHLHDVVGPDGKPQRIIIARDIDAAPHEARHAMDDVLGDQAVRVLNDAAKSSYSPEEWNQFTQHYADRLPGKAGQDPVKKILDASGWGDAQASEKIIGQVKDDLGPQATTAEVNAEASKRIQAARAATPEGQSFWETQLTPEEQADVKDQYIGSEVRAENHDAWFKGVGASNHVVDRMARAAANFVSALGGNPVEGRTAEFSGLPLRYPLVKAAEAGARETGVGAKVVVPKLPKMPKGPEGSPKAVQTQEERNNIIAAKAPDVALPGAAKTQREMMGVLNEARTSGTSVDVEYGHAGGSAPAAGADLPPAAVLGAVSRPERRAFIEAWRTMPIETRRFASKLFSPEQFMVTKTGKYQAFGGVHAVLAANAQKLATFLLAHPEVKTPYVVDPATKSFTSDSWKQIFTRLEDFSYNQVHGRTGAGGELVVPKMKGYFPPKVTEAARPIPQDEADIISGLFGQRTPETARIAKADVLPLNLAGQRVSEATKPGRVESPSLVSPKFGEGTEKHEELANKLGIVGEHVLETNPFMQRLNAYADAPSFIEARQRLNLEHMADVSHAAAEAPQLRGNTLTLAAGFQPNADPRAVKMAAIRDDKTGKIYEGPIHAFANLAYLSDKLGIKPDRYGNFPDDTSLRAWERQPNTTDGFTTNTPGEFLDRDQALVRAKSLGQYRTNGPDDTRLEAVSFNNQQKLTDAGYNPAEIQMQPNAEDLPELPAGDRLVSVRRPDGSIYPAAYGDKTWDFTAMGRGKVPSIATAVAGKWSHGLLPPGHEIIEGQPGISAANFQPRQLVTPEIEKKFSKSKIRFEDGTLRPVFHGSGAEFPIEDVNTDQFKAHFGAPVAAAVRTVGSRYELGASMLELGAAARVYPAYLDIRKPLEVSDAGDWDRASQVVDGFFAGQKGAMLPPEFRTGDGINKWINTRAKEMQDAFDEPPFPNRNVLERRANEEALDLIKNHLQKLGYDGIKYRNDIETSVAPRWVPAEAGEPVMAGHYQDVSPDESTMRDYSDNMSYIPFRKGQIHNALSPELHKKQPALPMQAQPEPWEFQSTPALSAEGKKLEEEGYTFGHGSNENLLHGVTVRKNGQIYGDISASQWKTPGNAMIGDWHINKGADQHPMTTEYALRAEMRAYLKSRGFKSVEDFLSGVDRSVQFQPSRDPRAIRMAAIKNPDTGKMYEGLFHDLAREAAIRDGHKLREVMHWPDGFSTNTPDEFLNRNQASERAQELKQISQMPKGHGLVAERLMYEKPTVQAQPNAEDRAAEKRYQDWLDTRAAYEKTPRWKEPMKGETETGRHSSYAGDADQGVILHSAKQRSTMFLNSGDKAGNFLKEWNATDDEAKRDALVESYFTKGSAQFAPRKSKQPEQDWELKAERGGMGLFSRAWILPDGTPVQIGSQLHHDWINENPQVTKRFGLKPTTTEISNRAEALQKGFARVSYDKNTGTLKIEARQKDWPGLKESARKLWDANQGKIDNFDVHLLDPKANHIVEQDGVALHTYDPEERKDHLPLISEPSPSTVMSEQASAPVTQFQPAERAGTTDKKEIADAKAKWKELGTESPYFKKWFSGSKIVDGEGKPVVVYHGTTHKFKEFSPERANVENFLGKGHYFSSDAQDAEGNYSGEGPDLKTRIEQLADRLSSENEDWSYTTAKAAARKQLHGPTERVIPAYLKFENPVIIDHEGGTRFEFEVDDAGNESGSAVDLRNSLLSVARDYRVDGQKIWNALTENWLEDFTAHDFLTKVHENDQGEIEDPETGELATSELVRRVFEDMGFDGAIQNDPAQQFRGMNIPSDTKHYIAFNGNQVKSAENRGTFSPRTARIDFQPTAEDFKSEETLPTALKSPHWALLTATQEAKGPGTNEENNKANDQLQQELIDAGHEPIPVAGSYKGVDQGKNFLIPGMIPAEAQKWGKQYGQESVLTPHGLLYQDNTVNPADHSQTVVGPEAEKQDFFSKVEGGPAFSMGIDFGKRVQFQPAAQELLGGGEEKRVISSSELGNMTNAEIAEHYPEAVIPRRRDEPIDSNIVGSPLAKTEGVQGFAKRLVDFADKIKDTPEYQAGLKWYSDFVPKLKKAFGKHTQMMAELLAATSPNTTPSVNFGFAFDALQMFLKGSMDKQVQKYQEGLAMLEGDKWRSWYDKELKAGRVTDPPQNPTPESFVAHWIDTHDLLPHQSNGNLYGMHSRAVLNVAARTWLERNAGPKTQNFVLNLLGKGHEATIDVWADRTMRRLGYEGFKPRWRILPKNGTGVSDADFSFSQDAFRRAAEQLGVKPDALQGALWFAEKKLWADEGWGRLDLGDFRKEIEKVPLLKTGVEQRLAAQNAKATVKPAETPDLLGLIKPRPTK